MEVVRVFEKWRRELRYIVANVLSSNLQHLELGCLSTLALLFCVLMLTLRLPETLVLHWWAQSSMHPMVRTATAILLLVPFLLKLPSVVSPPRTAACRCQIPNLYK